MGRAGRSESSRWGRKPETLRRLSLAVPRPFLRIQSSMFGQRALARMFQEMNKPADLIQTKAPSIVMGLVTKGILSL